MTETETLAPRLHTVREKEDAEQVEEVAKFLEECAADVRKDGLLTVLIVMGNGSNLTRTRWNGRNNEDWALRVAYLETLKHDILWERNNHGDG